MGGKALMSARLFSSRVLPRASRPSPQSSRCIALPRQHYVRLSHTQQTPKPMSQPMPQPNFSAGTTLPDAEAALAPLLTSAGGRWTLAAGGAGLERTFKFSTFAKAWDFMTAISIQCKIKKHHPEWSNIFNTIFIRWTTHNPKGLSTQDLEMARVCDAVAHDLGEIIQQPEEAQSCELSGLADIVVGSAGDCCTPRKK